MRLAPIALCAASMTLLACTPAPPRADARDPAPQPPPTEAFDHLEIHTGGAAEHDELPLILALHGRGDRPERFAPLFDAFPVPARVAILRPPHPFGGGLAWFRTARAATGSSARIARELAAHADRVVATADAIRRSRPTRGVPIVVGFSQGAMLTYAVAVRRPRAFAAAFPVSGLLFPELLEDAPPRSTRIVALHGRTDPLVSIDDDRRGVALLRSHGADVELREYDAPHTISGEMQRDLFAAMTAALAR